jgi:starch phosphorylase
MKRLVGKVRNGTPHCWVQMMNASIKTNAPVFNTDRMIADYVSQVYVPEIATRVGPILAKVLV